MTDKLEKSEEWAKKMQPKLEQAANVPAKNWSKLADSISLYLKSLNAIVRVMYIGSMPVQKTCAFLDKHLGSKSGKKVGWKSLALGEAVTRISNAATHAHQSLSSVMQAVEKSVQLSKIAKEKLVREKQLALQENVQEAQAIHKEIINYYQEMQKLVDSWIVTLTNIHKEATIIVRNKDGYMALGEVKEEMDKIDKKKYVEIQDLKYIMFSAGNDVPVQHLEHFLKGRIFAYGDIKGPITGLNEDGEIGINIQTEGLKDEFKGEKRFKIYPQAYFLKFEKQLIELEHQMIKAKSYKRFEEGLKKLEHGTFEKINSGNFMRVYNMFARYYEDKGLNSQGQLVGLEKNSPIRTIANSNVVPQSGMLRSRNLVNKLFRGVKLEHEFEGKKYMFVIDHFDERHVALSLENSHEQPMGVLLDHDLPIALNKLTLLEKKAPLERKIAELKPYKQTTLEELIEYMSKKVSPNPKKWQLDKWGFTGDEIGTLRLVAKYRMQVRHAKLSRAEHAKKLAA